MAAVNRHIDLVLTLPENETIQNMMEI